VLDLQEVKERYASLPKLARFGLVAVLGASFSLYQYFDKTPELESRLQSVNQESIRAQNRYENARKSSERLPALEAQLKDTEDQLRLARRYLPDEVEVDEVLHVTARLAREFGVELTSFTPGEAGEESPLGRYREVPMSLELKGTYTNIARLFDSLLHLEQVVHIRNIQLNAANVQQDDAANQSQRTAIDLRVTASMILFVGSGGV